MRSKDRHALVAMSRLPRSLKGRAALRQAVGALRNEYRRVRVEQRDEARVAGHPALVSVIAARSEKTRIRVLVAVLRTRPARLLEVFVAKGAPVKRVAEAQAILSGLRLQ